MANDHRNGHAQGDMAHMSGHANGRVNGHVVQTDGRTLISLSGRLLYIYMMILPAFAMFACVGLCLMFDFERSVWTGCRVNNYLPSISAAIGGFTPQRYIWRICIALHVAPRILVSFLYYNYYTGFKRGAHGWPKLLAGVAGVLHFCENMSLLTLSYVSSTENYPVHENSFYLFILFSQIYMMITLVLNRHIHHNQWTSETLRSYYVKKRVWLFNASSLVAAGYFFFRHNAYCEPGMYSIFAVTEYLVVLSNIAFHGSAVYDFGMGSLKFVMPQPGLLLQNGKDA